jgi:hypothetical protein
VVYIYVGAFRSTWGYCEVVKESSWRISKGTEFPTPWNISKCPFQGDFLSTFNTGMDIA